MWARLDDGFPDHPKILGLSDRAFRTHVEGICYAARMLTDGLVPRSAVRKRAGAVELVERGVWLAATDGYLIHDFLEYQRSREQVMAERQAATERRVTEGRRGGVASGERRATERSPDPTRPNPTQEPKPQTLARTALKDSLVSLSGWNPTHMSKSMWGRVERAAKEAEMLGAEPSDLAIAAELAREKYPGVDVTPQAIVGWLASVEKWQAEPTRRRK